MIFEKLQEIIADKFPIDMELITVDTSFTGDLGADSLDLVDLVMSIEEEFDLPELPEENICGMDTVGDIAAYLADIVDGSV